MRTLILGFIMGVLLSSSGAWAFHYFGHDPNVQEQERFQQQWERNQQEQFRNQQRMDQYLKPPC